MTEAAMPNAAPNSADLFEIIRTTRSMRRLKPDPVPNEVIRKILRGGCVCAERRKHAAVAVPRD
jgi:hypothetical protein